MALTEVRPRQIARPNLGFAYLMIGIAVGCIVVSGVLGSIFSPNFVSTSGTATGYIRQHTPVAAYSGWFWDVIALGMLAPAAMRGIRAKVTDRAPWMMLGLGVGGIWLAVMFVSIFAPVMVTGTAPWLTWVPLGEMLSVIVGIILTGLLCKFVKAGFFEPTEAPPRTETNTQATLESEPDDATVTLRRLAQLRDSGTITEAEFEAKKHELLSRI